MLTFKGWKQPITKADAAVQRTTSTGSGSLMYWPLRDEVDKYDYMRYAHIGSPTALPVGESPAQLEKI